RCPVMRLEHHEPECLSQATVDQVADSDDVADRLRHLVAAELQQTVVYPVAREGLGAEIRFRLRDLVLVVREDQVRAAAVDIDRAAEVVRAHRGALDVPARAPRSPRTRPARLAGLGGLPER